MNAHVTLHICYGNRYGKPSFEGSYQFLFPAIMEAKVQAISMEFARRGEEDLQLFKIQRALPGGHRRDRRQDATKSSRPRSSPTASAARSK